MGFGIQGLQCHSTQVGARTPGRGTEVWPREMLVRLRVGLGLGWRLLALLAALAVPLGAQALAMRHFDSRDGITQSQVTALVEDRNGFIWVSVNDAVTRLGQSGFQVFDSSNGMQLKDINGLLEDRQGAIWVASAGKGVARIRGREVTNFGNAEGLQDLNIHSMFETPSGELLIGSLKGLFRLRGQRFERVPLPAPWDMTSFTALCSDGRGGLWLGSRKGVLAHWNGSTVDQAALPPTSEANSILNLAQDPSGQVWALQSNRLLRLSGGGSWEVEPLPGAPADAAFRRFNLDRQGELLIAMGTDGLYLYNTKGEHHSMNARELLCRDSVFCALRDRNGDLWLGTNGDYLWSQPFPPLHSLVRHPDTGVDLGLGTVCALMELPDHRVLLGSNNGVFLWEEGKGLVQHWTGGDGLVSQEVWSFFPDGHGGAWVGTHKGVQRLGPGGRLLPGPKELATTHVQAMVRVGDRFWACTDKGLAELDAEGRFVALHDPLSLVGYTSVHCLIPREDDLLVGTSLGLLSFKDGTFSRAFPGTPTDKLQVLALHQDTSRRLWVGTSQNLWVRDPRDSSWGTLSQDAGSQPMEGINWIKGLANGLTAIGHGRGVSLVSPEGKAFHLTRRLGLLSDETNQGAAMADQQGRLWIGMVGGVCILDRLDRVPQPLASRPVVLDLTWAQGSFAFPKVVTLPPGFANLAVHIDAGSPNVAFPVRFEAKLDDPAGPWHALESGVGGIYYGGLSPGRHRLVFRSSLDGVDWRESEPLLMTIQPPWYLSLWAKGLLLVVGVLAAYAGVKYRVRLLQRNNRDLEAKVAVRTRELEGRTQELAQRNQAMEWIHRELRSTLESRMQMINTVSHDLRSPLTSIRLSVDRLQESPEPMQPRVTKILGVMAHEAQRLEAIIKGVLDRNREDALAVRLSLQAGTPREILEGLEGTLTLKGESLGLRTQLSLEPISLDVEILLDPAAMQQVLFNLVENALKFTPRGGKVGVRSSLVGADWMLEIWDTGRGIPKDQCERLFHPFEQGQVVDAKQGWGLGLYICRSIVEAHGGRIEVESTLGEGSVFKVLLPIVKGPAGHSELDQLLDLNSWSQPGSTPLPK